MVVAEGAIEAVVPLLYLHQASTGSTTPGDGTPQLP